MHRHRYAFYIQYLPFLCPALTLLPLFTNHQPSPQPSSVSYICTYSGYLNPLFTNYTRIEQSKTEYSYFKLFFDSQMIPLVLFILPALLLSRSVPTYMFHSNLQMNMYGKTAYYVLGAGECMRIQKTTVIEHRDKYKSSPTNDPVTPLSY
mmetsp:Transcript_26516/g.53001  ORF Transcript_26516/g.53001 Transcript_26516/m.53001 type:complete len:150 (-) Transcript_26516:1528-1977(-)